MYREDHSDFQAESSLRSSNVRRSRQLRRLTTLFLPVSSTIQSLAVGKWLDNTHRLVQHSYASVAEARCRRCSGLAVCNNAEYQQPSAEGHKDGANPGSDSIKSPLKLSKAPEDIV